MSFNTFWKNKNKKSFGTENAGPIPTSLLARQDLEGVAEDMADDEETQYGTKGMATNDALVQIKDKSEDADTKEEKDSLVDRIKTVQVKRQKAALKDRGVVKSFLDGWKESNKLSN